MLLPTHKLSPAKVPTETAEALRETIHKLKTKGKIYKQMVGLMESFREMPHPADFKSLHALLRPANKSRHAILDLKLELDSGWSSIEPEDRLRVKETMYWVKIADIHLSASLRIIEIGDAVSEQHVLDRKYRPMNQEELTKLEAGLKQGEEIDSFFPEETDAGIRKLWDELKRKIDEQEHDVELLETWSMLGVVPIEVITKYKYRHDILNLQLQLDYSWHKIDL